MVVKAAKVARLPANTDFVVGSAILHGYLTAHYALAGRAHVKAGETVLVTGAAGGVGLACVELAHLLGARVIAVVGSAAKGRIVREQGADEVIDHSCEDVAQRVKTLTGGKGLDVCIDNVGGALFGVLARLMGWNGRLLPIGFTSGDIPTLAMNLPLLKNYSVLGTFAGAWGERCPEEAMRARADVMEWVRDGELRPRVDRVLPLERYTEAMSAIADRSVIGRIVLQVR
jgi:NADPH2:quinone reductase